MNVILITSSDNGVHVVNKNVILITSSDNSVHVVNKNANQFEKLLQLEEALVRNDSHN
jgi:hypothetical protein